MYVMRTRKPVLQKALSSAMKANLTKKTITDKTGKRTTVYVKTGDEAPAPVKQKKTLPVRISQNAKGQSVIRNPKTPKEKTPADQKPKGGEEKPTDANQKQPGKIKKTYEAVKGAIGKIMGVFKSPAGTQSTKKKVFETVKESVLGMLQAMGNTAGGGEGDPSEVPEATGEGVKETGETMKRNKELRKKKAEEAEKASKNKAHEQNMAKIAQSVVARQKKEREK